MRRIFWLFLFLTLATLVFAKVEVENNFFAFKYQKSDFLKNGYYADSQIKFQSINDIFKITCAYHNVVPKRSIKYSSPVDIHLVKTDSVYYHDVWVDGTFYETFVYDTTFVDTSYTVLEDKQIHPDKISQMEILFDWNHRQELWYYFGLGIKLSTLSDGQKAVTSVFHQTFYKTLKTVSLSYQNSLLFTLFNSKTDAFVPVTKITDERYDTTQDSIYMYNPDSVFTYIHTEETYQYPVEKWRNKTLLQISNTITATYKKLNFSASYAILKDEDKINGYYKLNFTYLSYLHTLDFIYFSGKPFMMHDFEYKYFNTIKEKLLYGVYGIAKFYPLNKKWSVKFGLSYSKLEDLNIKGVLLGFGLNF